MIRNVNGLDSEAVQAAVAEAVTPCGRPTLVCCKTIIGFGAPKLAGTHDVHGAALGGREWRRARRSGLDLSAVRSPGGHPRCLGCAGRRRRAAGASGSPGSPPTLPRSRPRAEFTPRVSGALPADARQRRMR